MPFFNLDFSENLFTVASEESLMQGLSWGDSGKGYIFIYAEKDVAFLLGETCNHCVRIEAKYLALSYPEKQTQGFSR